MSWKPEVTADDTGKWYTNGLRFATEREAREYALDLFNRWTVARAHRASECEDPVTHILVDGRPEPV